MKGTLRYLGSMPVHSLKIAWQPGMEVSLDKVFELLGSNCPSKPTELDDEFVGWFHATFMPRLGKDFELSLADDDFSEEDRVELAQISNPKKSSGKISLTTTSVEVSSSAKEARAKLKNMRHPDEVGHTELEKHEDTATQRISAREQLKSQPKPGSQVMTGDDLAKTNNVKALVLDMDGGARAVAPISKEQERSDNAKMANLSRRASILTPDIINDDGSRSQIIMGEDADPDAVTKGYSKKVIDGEDHRVVNKNKKAYPTYSEGAAVQPEDIITANQTSEKDAALLISACKSSTALKVARIYARNTGSQRLVELIDRKLRSLPPGS